MFEKKGEWRKILDFCHGDGDESRRAKSLCNLMFALRKEFEDSTEFLSLFCNLVM